MSADCAALVAKLKWAYPRGPSHVTQEEWRVVLDALAAPLDRETLARALRAEFASFRPCCANWGEVADAVLARLAAAKEVSRG